MFRKLLVSTVVAFALVGAACAPPVPPHVTISDDQFSKAVEIFGWGNYENPYGGIDRTWRIRSWVDKQTQQVTHQIYVELNYQREYQYFRQAADDTARSLPVLQIDRASDCPRYQCTHYETIGIAIDDATLRARADKGFLLKISARRGSELILPISPTQIALQLAAVDQLAQAAPKP